MEPEIEDFPTGCPIESGSQTLIHGIENPVQRIAVFHESPVASQSKEELQKIVIVSFFVKNLYFRLRCSTLRRGGEGSACRFDKSQLK